MPRSTGVSPRSYEKPEEFRQPISYDPRLLKQSSSIAKIEKEKTKPDIHANQ